MNIGKYIKELLQEHDTVIVPGLGAFVSVYKPAYSDDKTGILNPPSKIVSFNQNIKDNGGLLVDHIASIEHISHRKAAGKLEKICDEILYRLDKGENVTIEDTGTLRYDKNGILCFEPAPSLNFLADAFGLEPVPLNDKKEALLVEDNATLRTKNINDQQKELVNSIDKPGQSQSYGLPLPEPRESEDELRGSGLHRFIFWSLIVIVPAILITLGIYLFRKKRSITSHPIEIIIEPATPVTEPYNEQSAVVPSDTAKTDTVKADSSLTEITQITDTVGTDAYITPVRSEYYLIGGSFKKEENAKKYFQQMKEKGYEPFHLEKKGNFYIVGIGIFDTEREAFIAQANFIDKYPDSGAWVLIPE